jgi:hypothetical protein
MTEPKLKKLLSDLPANAEDSYQRMLNRSTNHALTRKLLSITLAAERPLTISEAKYALGFTESTFNCLSEMRALIESDDAF